MSSLSVSVHWIEAFLDAKAMHSEDHENRFKLLARTIELKRNPKIAANYGLLKSDSKNARCECYKHTHKDLIDRVKADIQKLIQPPSC